MSNQAMAVSVNMKDGKLVFQLLVQKLEHLKCGIEVTAGARAIPAVAKRVQVLVMNDEERDGMGAKRGVPQARLQRHTCRSARSQCKSRVSRPVGGGMPVRPCRHLGSLSYGERTSIRTNDTQSHRRR